MEAHKKKCPDKPQIDPKIMNEMKKYIQMVKENNEPPKADEIIDELSTSLISMFEIDDALKKYTFYFDKDEIQF